MGFVRDISSCISPGDFSPAAHSLMWERQRGFIGGWEEGKVRHCSEKRVERLWARGRLMPHNGKRSGENEDTTEGFVMTWCLVSFSSFWLLSLTNSKFAFIFKILCSD
ncbi:hypothetical protein TNCT_644681 [Trichonephila clavata]|uniref:Uncharacterized protein n=1 Tax=Trichonephila clavata TaxID=2740835 RepID=A0A8X6GJG7_TRICU|nr:hypothetical protein TNCT_644681 [Trichonephila clavata]